ncbi:hypothetical protein CMZ84_03070 [Lysobacteraceae bacterium NML93-0399]|nr:hypothetical protein CMZ84_03070 [Xanthomonadaceae bacterium NML93-0399]
MDRTRLLAPLLLLFPLALQAAGPIDADGLCAPWREIAVPATDAGTPLPGCDTMTLYYGADGKGGDPEAARHCAYADRAAGDGKVFGGSAVLMMLYANGEGVARDLRLARRFACEYGGAPAEVSARLAHLQRVEDDAASKRFDVCDDITSGYMAGFCVGRAASFAHVAREREWQALQSDWTPAQKAAWHSVRQAADAYFEYAGSAEIDLTGTARAAFSVDARQLLEVQLLDDVQAFERGRLPGHTAADFARADRELNLVYGRVRSELRAGATAPEYSLFGTITADGVRDTQRAWLRYRDAWVAFAATRWPDTPADTWRAWLTESRTQMLASIVDSP